jgi:hypothetical protein
MFMLQAMITTFMNIALVNRLLIGRLLVDVPEFIRGWHGGGWIIKLSKN